MSNEKCLGKMNMSVDFLLQKLQDPCRVKKPMAKVAHLYVLKALFEESPVPRVMELFFEQGFLKTLQEILEKEYFPQDNTNELVLYTLAMEFLWLFSGLNDGDLSPLASDSMMALITQFTDVHNRFYQYSTSLTSHLSRLHSKVLFIQQKVIAQPVTEEMWNDILFYNPKVTRYGAISHVHHVSLSTPLVRKRKLCLVSSQLVQDGLAWPNFQAPKSMKEPIFETIAELVHPQCCDSSPTECFDNDDDDVDGDESERQDVFFLDVIGGHYFWAYIGSGALVALNSLTSLLQVELPHLKSFVPKMGNMVVISDEHADEHKPNVMRGIVTEVNDDEVTLFAVDFGTVKKVKMDCVYDLSQSDSGSFITNFKVLAKICCVAGIQPPPADMPTVELALTTLINLTKTSVAPGSIFAFDTAGGIENLQILIKVAPLNIRLQVVRLISNLTSISQLSKDKDWVIFIRPLLEIVAELGRNFENDSLKQDILVASLYALTNILYSRPECRDTFFCLHGHLIVLNLMRNFKCCTSIVRAAASMLRAAYPGFVKPVFTNWFQKDSSDEEEEEKECDRTDAQKREEFLDEEIGEVLHRLFVEDLLSEDSICGTGMDDEKKIKDDGGLVSEEDTTHVDSVLTASEKSLYNSGSSHQTSEATACANNQVSVNYGSYCEPIKNFYKFNTCVTFQEDCTHHLLEAEDISSIDVISLTETVCAMLNSEGGTIYIGLTKERIVRGVKMSRDERDSLRCVINDLMTKTEPSLPHTHLRMEYVPVVNQDTETLQLCEDTFVVEIFLPHTGQPIFYTAGKDTACFQRHGTASVQLTAQVVQKITVTREECRYLSRIRTLRKQIQQLKDNLKRR